LFFLNLIGECDWVSFNKLLSALRLERVHFGEDSSAIRHMQCAGFLLQQRQRSASSVEKNTVVTTTYIHT